MILYVVHNWNNFSYIHSSKIIFEISRVDDKNLRKLLMRKYSR